MLKVKLSPSIERADQLNLEAEIRRIEKAGCSFMHYDVMEPRMFGSTKMNPDALKPIGEKFKICRDIHILSPQPNCLLDALLPYAAGGNYITFYPEETFDGGNIVKKTIRAGGKAGVSLYTAGSLCHIEELIPLLSIVTLIIRDAQSGETELHPGILDKIRRCRKMLDDAGRQDCDLAVDGSVNYNDMKPLLDAGANVLILGSKTCFKPGKPCDENLEDVKKHIRDLGYELEEIKY